MKKELEDLLRRLLQSIIANGKAGVNNAIMDLDIDFAEWDFDYLIKALTELKHLEDGEEVDFRNVSRAFCDCTGASKCTKQSVKDLLDYGYNCVESKELYSMYHPSDELLDEFIDLMWDKRYLDWVSSIPADVILD